MMRRTRSSPMPSSPMEPSSSRMSSSERRLKMSSRLRMSSSERMQRNVYRRALSQGQVSLAYGRVMLIGPAGAGKTSLRRGLMGMQYNPKMNSTVVADIHSLRPKKESDVKKNAAKSVIDCQWIAHQWQKVDEEDERKELAQLMAIVGKTSKDNETEVEEWFEGELEGIVTEALNSAIHIDPPEECQPLYHLWDCGGQPIFLDLLTAFLTSRTMFLILFNASQSLHDNWEIMQYWEGKKMAIGTANMSTLELMERWMSCIHAYFLKKDDKGAFLTYPRVLPIGTRGDQLQDEMKGQVLTSLDEYFENKAFQQVLLNPVIIDNTTAGAGNSEDPNYKHIRKEVFKFTTENLKKPTPVTWVLFRKKLQLVITENQKNTVTLEEAHSIAGDCKIAPEDVPSLLSFYHELGVLLYYPHIEGLQSTVILNPEWFVKYLGKVFTFEGEEEYRMKREWSLFRNHGILVQPLYREVWKDEVIDPEHIMQLLTFFRLAVEVPKEYYYDHNAREFFVPAVLPYTNDLSPNISKSRVLRFIDGLKSSLQTPSKSAPIVIEFTSGYVVPGFFTRFLTVMAESPDCSLHFKAGIFRNQVVYKFGDPQVFLATVAEESHGIQIEVECMIATSPIEMQIACSNILSLSLSCCETVQDCLHSDFVFSNEHYQPRFEKRVKVACLAKKCQHLPLHFLVFPAGKTVPNGEIACEVDDRNFRRIRTEEAYWYYPTDPRTSAIPEAKQVFRLLKEKSNQWDAIGRELGVSFEFRESLQEGISAALSNDAKLERVLNEWIESKCSEVSWDTICNGLKALKFINTLQTVDGFLRANQNFTPKRFPINFGGAPRVPIYYLCCILAVIILLLFFTIIYN